jgi:hypothetical protein
MRIKRTDTIAGQPIKLARDLAKELSNASQGGFHRVDRQVGAED